MESRHRKAQQEVLPRRAASILMYISAFPGGIHGDGSDDEANDEVKRAEDGDPYVKVGGLAVSG